MEFKITRGSGRCTVTGRKFEDGEQFIVALSPDPKEEGLFQRQDICLAAWQRQSAGAFAAFWPSRYSVAKKPVLLDPDMLWQVFHRARTPVEGDDAAEMPRFAYVAALGLMRLKKLKLKGTRRQGKTEHLVFETPGKGKDRETYEVVNPGLDEAGIEKVQDRLSELV